MRSVEEMDAVWTTVRLTGKPVIVPGWMVEDELRQWNGIADALQRRNGAGDLATDIEPAGRIRRGTRETSHGSEKYDWLIEKSFPGWRQSDRRFSMVNYYRAGHQLPFHKDGTPGRFSVTTLEGEGGLSTIWVPTEPYEREYPARTPSEFHPLPPGDTMFWDMGCENAGMRHGGIMEHDRRSLVVRW